MSDLVSIEGDGAARARGALESCIGRGGVAIFPADTLYGLACDPLNAAAIGRLQRLKGRSAGKPSAVLYFSVLAMRELVAGLGPRTRDALGALLPGVLPGKGGQATAKVQQLGLEKYSRIILESLVTQPPEEG